MTGDAGDPGLEPGRGLPTESRVFGTMGTFALVICIVYASVSGPEWAGTASLAATAIFGLGLALFFARRLRAVQASVVELEYEQEHAHVATDEVAATGDVERDDGLYLPETSIWPFFIGLAVSMVALGMAFGWWFVVPGLLLLGHSVVGFANQSRHRART